MQYDSVEAVNPSGNLANMESAEGVFTATEKVLDWLKKRILAPVVVAVVIVSIAHSVVSYRTARTETSTNTATRLVLTPYHYNRGEVSATFAQARLVQKIVFDGEPDPTNMLFVAINGADPLPFTPVLKPGKTEKEFELPAHAEFAPVSYMCPNKGITVYVLEPKRL